MMRKQLWIFILTILLPCHWAVADGGSAVASLSSNSAEVGEELQLEIRASGLKNPQPPEVRVEGLAIRFQGRQEQQQLSIVNGNFTSTSSISFNYSVVPEKPGRFEIPPIKIVSDKGSFTTESLRLEVKGSAEGESSPRMFAETVLPKNSAYVGEAIPVELRFYVDAAIRWQIEQAPAFAADGFTTQKLGKPSQNQVSRGGKTYDLVTFKTAITPVKIGKLTIGPVELPCAAQVPQKRRHARPGIGSLQDFFNDDFFASQLQAVRRVAIKSAAQELEIKALPTGAPSGFSGAVGQFELSTSASPLSVKVGDPITMKISVHGRGNLDRVTAPALSDATGWKTYAPSAKIEPDDDLGISGTKRFEMAVVPQELKTETPELVFAYFDPVAEAYKVLRTERFSLSVAPSGAPAVGNAVALPASPLPAEPAAKTILHIVDSDSGWGRSFAPLYVRKQFWLWQIVPASGVLLLGASALWRVKAKAKSGRDARLQQAKQQAMRQMLGCAIAREDFYRTALDYLQSEAARSSERTPSTLECADVCGARSISGELSRAVEEVFETCQSLRYSGADAGREQIGDEERDRVLKTLKSYEETHARP